MMQRDPERFGPSFEQGQSDFMPRSVNIISHSDIGPLPWGTDLDFPENAEIVNKKLPLSNYHNLFYDKNSQSYQNAYASQMQRLLENWSASTPSQAISDARIRLENIERPTDYMEYKRDLAKYNDFQREREEILDLVRKELEQCDTVSGFLFCSSSNELPEANKVLLEYMGDSAPKESILLFDSSVNSEYTPFERSIAQHTLNEYSSHGVFTSEAVEQLYGDTASPALKLTELLAASSQQNYSFDSLTSGLQVTPYLNLLDCQGALEKGLLPNEIEQLRDSFAHVMLSGSSVENASGRFLCLECSPMELSETFPHLFSGNIPWRTNAAQEMALYNGRHNECLLEPQLELCGRFHEFQKKMQLDEVDCTGAAEFIREQHKAYADGV